MAFGFAGAAAAAVAVVVVVAAGLGLGANENIEGLNALSEAAPGMVAMWSKGRTQRLDLRARLAICGAGKLCSGSVDERGEGRCRVSRGISMKIRDLRKDLK